MLNISKSLLARSRQAHLEYFVQPWLRHQWKDHCMSTSQSISNWCCWQFLKIMFLPLTEIPHRNLGSSCAPSKANRAQALGLLRALDRQEWITINQQSKTIEQLRPQDPVPLPDFSGYQPGSWTNVQDSHQLLHSWKQCSGITPIVTKIKHVPKRHWIQVQKKSLCATCISPTWLGLWGRRWLGSELVRKPIFGLNLVHLAKMLQLVWVEN